MNVYDVFDDKHYPVAGLEEARQLVNKMFAERFPDNKIATMNWKLSWFCVTDDCFDCICDRIRDHVSRMN